MARIILNRLSKHVSDNVLPEAQCGFRSGPGTTDVMFPARQLQEKCREHHRDLYIVFVDLTKVFDSVNRNLLWRVLGRIDCLCNLVNIIRSFHNNMSASIIDSGASSKSFAVTNGVKQGCVLAPLLFNIFFSVMLHVAFRNCDKGVYLQTHSNGNIFNLCRFNEKIKVSDILIRDLLFAVDCALVVHTM